MLVLAKTIFWGALTALALNLASCAHPKTKEEIAEHPEEAPPKTVAAKPPESSIEAKTVAAEEQASFVTELNFAKGKNTLTPDSRERLTKLVDQARAKGKINELKVISWADAEYPSVHTKRLSKGQIRLANQRNEEISRFLKNVDRSVKVNTYNMAERPNAFSDLIGSSNAHVKKSLEVAGIPNTDSSVKAPAKASKAIVMAILKE